MGVCYWCVGLGVVGCSGWFGCCVGFLGWVWLN